jgi:hypothetical protein
MVPGQFRGRQTAASVGSYAGCLGPTMPALILARDQDRQLVCALPTIVGTCIVLGLTYRF